MDPNHQFSHENWAFAARSEVQALKPVFIGSTWSACWSHLVPKIAKCVLLPMNLSMLFKTQKCFGFQIPLVSVLPFNRSNFLGRKWAIHGHPASPRCHPSRASSSSAHWAVHFSCHFRRSICATGGPWISRGSWGDPAVSKWILKGLIDQLIR